MDYHQMKAGSWARNPVIFVSNKIKNPKGHAKQWNSCLHGFPFGMHKFSLAVRWKLLKILGSA